MSNLEQQLQSATIEAEKIKTTKAAISAAIVEKGGDLAGKTFADYPNAITSLQTGGGAISVSDTFALCSGSLSANVAPSGQILLANSASAHIPKNSGTIILLGESRYYDGLVFSNGATDLACNENYGHIIAYPGSACMASTTIMNNGSIEEVRGVNIGGENSSTINSFLEIVNLQGGSLNCPADFLTVSGGTVNIAGEYVDFSNSDAHPAISSAIISGGETTFAGSCWIETLQQHGGTVNLDTFVSSANISGGICNVGSGASLDILTQENGEINTHGAMLYSIDVFGGTYNCFEEGNGGYAYFCNATAHLYASPAQMVTAGSGATVNVNFTGYIYIDSIYGTVNANSGGEIYCDNMYDGTVTLHNGTNVLFSNMSGGIVYMESACIYSCGYISGGTIFVGEGAEVCSATITDSGRISVKSGGRIISAGIGIDYDGYTMSSGGFVTVDTGGNMNDTILGNDATAEIFGKTLNTVISAGSMTVMPGGSASDVSLSGGYLYVSSGGTATMVHGDSSCVTVEDGGYVEYW